MKEKDTGGTVVGLMIAIDKLPEEAQLAICMAIKNIGFIRELCKTPETEREALEKYMKKYRAEDEYFGQILAGLALSYMDGEA